jgi:hypothetical protein
MKMSVNTNGDSNNDDENPPEEAPPEEETPPSDDEEPSGLRKIYEKSISELRKILEEAIDGVYTMNFNFYGFNLTFPNPFVPLTNLLLGEKESLGAALEIDTFINKGTLLPYFGRFSGEANKQFSENLQMILTDTISTKTNDYLKDQFTEIDGTPDLETELKKGEKVKDKDSYKKLYYLLMGKKVENDNTNYDGKVTLQQSYEGLKGEINSNLIDKFTTNFPDFYNDSMSKTLGNGFTAFSSIFSYLFGNLSSTFNSVPTDFISGPYAYIHNSFTVDVGQIGNILALSAFLLDIGFFIIILIVLIRRRGMLTKEEAKAKGEKKSSSDNSHKHHKKRKSKNKEDGYSDASDSFSDAGTYFGTASNASKAGSNGTTYHSSGNSMGTAPAVTNSEFWIH